MQLEIFNIIWENTLLFAIGNGADFRPQFEGSDGSDLNQYSLPFKGSFSFFLNIILYGSQWYLLNSSKYINKSEKEAWMNKQMNEYRSTKWTKRMSLASLWSNEFWKHILFASIKQYTDRHNLELGGGGGGERSTIKKKFFPPKKNRKFFFKILKNNFSFKFLK